MARTDPKGASARELEAWQQQLISCPGESAKLSAWWFSSPPNRKPMRSPLGSHWAGWQRSSGTRGRRSFWACSRPAAGISPSSRLRCIGHARPSNSRVSARAC